MEAAHHAWPALGVLLVRDGLVSKEELEEILEEQRDARQQRLSGRHLGEILVGRGSVTTTQIARLVAEQYELPFVDLDTADIDLRCARVLGEELARRLSAIPIHFRVDGSYLLAIAEPGVVLFSDELRQALGSSPHFAVVGPEAIAAAISFVHDQPHELPDAMEDSEDEEAPGVVVEFRGDSSSETIADDHSAVEARPVLARGAPPLGALLLREGLVNQDSLREALAQQRLSTSWRLGEILVDRGIVTPAAVARLIAEQYELSYVELGEIEIDRELGALLPLEVARKYQAIPIAKHDGGSLDVAIADPTNGFYCDELHGELGVPLTFVVASPDAIEAALQIVHTSGAALAVIAAPEEHTDDLGTLPDADEDGAGDEIASVGAAARWLPTWTTELQLADEVLEPFETEIDVPGLRDEVPEDLSTALLSEVTHGYEADELIVTAGPAEPYEDLEAETDPSMRDEALEDLSTAFLPEVPQVHEAGELTVAVEPSEPYEDSETEIEDPGLRDEVPEDLSTAFLPKGPPQDYEADELTIATEPIETYEAAEWDVAAEPAAPEEDSETKIDELSVRGEVHPDLSAVLLPEVTHHPQVDDLIVAAEPAEPYEDLEAETEHPSIGDEVPDDLSAAFLPELAHIHEAGEPTVAAEPAESYEDSETEIDERGEDGDDLDEAIEHEIALGATAIHFSPQGEWHSVRVRTDGLVRELGVVSPDDLESLVARIEATGAMRVHVTPTKQGDKVTLFPRAGSTTPIALTELGMGVDALETIQETLARRAGVTVVCGPGASGTTTTLYAALDVLNTPDRVVATIEAPVDRVVEGIDQMEVDAPKGITFSRGLETLLAIDSDVVLVGELSDRETAELAFGAAHAGRQILGRLGVPSSARAIRQLTKLGVDSKVLAEALACVVAQRLVMRVCGECRETYYASESELAELGQPVEGIGPRLLARGRGCEACDGTGYRDRVGLFEVLPVSDEIRQLIETRASSKEIHDAAAASGMRTLREDGIRLCLEGVTTFAEIQRVLGAED